MFGGKIKPAALMTMLGGKEKAAEMLVPMLKTAEPAMADAMIKKGESLEGLIFGTLAVPAVKGDIKKVAMINVALSRNENGKLVIIEELEQDNFSNFLTKTLLPNGQK